MRFPGADKKVLHWVYDCSINKIARSFIISKKFWFKTSCLQYFTGKTTGILTEFKYSTLFNCRERLNYMEGGGFSIKKWRGRGSLIKWGKEFIFRSEFNYKKSRLCYFNFPQVNITYWYPKEILNCHRLLNQMLFEMPAGMLWITKISKYLKELVLLVYSFNFLSLI